MIASVSAESARNKAKLYVTGATAGLVARALSLGAGFGNLWLLTQILTKEQFAGYVFVLAILTWLAMLGTAGLDQTILYRLSRADASPGHLAGGSLVAAALLTVLPVSGALAILVALAPLAGDLDHLPGLGFWLTVFAPVVMTICLGRIFEAWFWARGRIAPSVLVPAIGDIARTIGLLVAFVVLPTTTGVALAVVVAALVPLLVWWAIAPRAALQRPARFTRQDVGYGVKAMLGKATNEGTHQIDVIMIGILAIASATADYAVAARLAALVGGFKGLLAPVFTPRLGRLSAAGSRDALLREYRQVRLLGLVVALVCASLAVALGRPALALFGDYQQSYPLMMILIAGFVVSAGFGSNASFLTITGHAGWTLVARLALLMVIVILNSVLIPMMGAKGAALSMAIGMAAVNALLCAMIWHVDNLPTISRGLLSLLGAAYGLLLLSGFEVIGGTVAALGLGAVTGILLVVEVPLWLPAAKQLFRVEPHAGHVQ